MTLTPSNQSYTTLCQHILNEIRQGESNIAQFVDFQKVATNWNIGRLIDTYLLNDEHRSQVGPHLYARLESDIGINKRILLQSVQFYQYYPDLQKIPRFTWTHYTLLITISDETKRKMWERRIEKENITCTQLRLMIRPNKKQESVTLSTKDQLPFLRGVPFSYRVVKVSYIHGKAHQLMIDCGFSIHIERPFSENLNITSACFIEVDKHNHAYTLKESKSLKKDALYTYKALIERVVDGDTLLVNIDCGFGIWTRQRIRLKGINAPERNTDAGLKAKRYIEERLSEVKFIIIKTYGSDKYDRYLGDIFYLAGEDDVKRVAQEGCYLNWELVEQGLAGVYQQS